ncbi:MAG: N-acetyl-gamma-glutamyl-phosphate reductase [Planctomycetales bacterium]|nr:N-acetyl-gamma-glutamyl-phosphate reductase [Planctomycetales bacterium]
MIRVAILGATGYTALELIQILLRHPEAEITALTSRQEGNPPISSIHPQLTARIDMPLESLSYDEVADRADCVFSCLPHGASAEAVAPLLAAGCKVIDFSADYRLDTLEVFEQWYGAGHPDANRLGTVVYGLPELFREKIRGAQLVANPGCYPTSANLALVPLLVAGLIDSRGIVIDSKSGVSGAGRTPKLATLYPECNESISAYNVGQHRHTPEIDQTLSAFSSKPVEVIFTPHLTPMTRGILSTAYSYPQGDVSETQLMDQLREFYSGQPCVRVVEHLPATRHCSGTPFCDITARRVRDRVVTISCLDNLLKGASSMAVQNFNLMYDLPEAMAL